MDVHPQVESSLLKRLYGTGALIEGGHFVYRSGRHGSAYMDHWQILRHTREMHYFARIIAERFTYPEDKIDAVVGLARGGGYVALWLAYHLSLMMGKNIPWFSIPKNEVEGFHYLDSDTASHLADKRVLLADDVVSTGSGLVEATYLLREINSWPTGVTAVVNRGGLTQARFPFIQKFFTLFSLPLISWGPDECPLCLDGVAISTTHGHGARIVLQDGPMRPEELIECSD